MIDTRGGTMKDLKTLILVGGLLFMLVMCLYPPWVYQDGNGKQQPMGYSFIWSPPREQIDKSANLLGFKLNIELGELKANAIDLGRLSLQECVAAVIVFGAAIVAGKDKK